MVPRMDGLDPLRDALGMGGVVTEPELVERYLVDQRELLRGAAPAVLRPANTAAVARAVVLARTLGFGLVPQGGNTGYCGGATPVGPGRQLVLSLERLDRIRAVDALGCTMEAEAGVVLRRAQDAAAAAGLLLPLSLGAEGSCQLGGNLSTNAGGVQVLRWGMARELVLGLETVLPDGTVLDEMRTLRKRNAGYDLKQLFIGAEGTLGIITAAALRLVPAQVQCEAAWIALGAGVPLAELLLLLRRETADLLSSFEWISPASLVLLREQVTGSGTSALPAGSGGAVLVEASASTVRVPLADLMGHGLEAALERGWADDAVLAQSGAQRQAMWAAREGIPEAEKRGGGSVKHDISIPLPDLTRFFEAGTAAAVAWDSEVRLSAYGHVGDGNLHFNVLVPPGADRLAYGRHVGVELSPRLYELALGMGGMFSAEHGIGRLKRGLLEAYLPEPQRRLMSALKGTLDPVGLMNAGAVVDPPPALQACRLTL